MGRKKIEIKRSGDPEVRRHYFGKRGPGLITKGHEFGILTDSNVTIIVDNPDLGQCYYSTNGNIEMNLKNFLDKNNKFVVLIFLF